jgi:hypothetical protein
LVKGEVAKALGKGNSSVISNAIMGQVEDLQRSVCLQALGNGAGSYVTNAVSR